MKKAVFILLVIALLTASCELKDLPIINVELTRMESSNGINWYFGTLAFSPVPGTSLQIDSVDYGEGLFIGFGEDTTGIDFSEGTSHTMQATADGISVSGSVIMPYDPTVSNDIGSHDPDTEINIPYTLDGPLPDMVNLYISDTYTVDGESVTISVEPDSATGTLTIPAGTLLSEVSGYLYFSVTNLDPLDGALTGSAFMANSEVDIYFITTP